MLLACFPGWASSIEIDHFCGYPAMCFSHNRQLDLLTGKQVPETLSNELPEDEDWVLVTWSMGGWTGLILSAYWRLPPRAWIALSPFYEFCGDGKPGHDDLQRLICAWKVAPERCLKLFDRANGAMCPWRQKTDILPEWEDSLVRLGQPAPKPEALIDVPLLAARGSRDTLSTRRSLEEFLQLFSTSESVELEQHGHGLFYEQPEELERALSRYLS